MLDCALALMLVASTFADASDGTCVCKGGARVFDSSGAAALPSSAVYGAVCGKWDAPDENPWCIVAASDSCGGGDTYQALLGHFWSHKPCVGQQAMPYDPSGPPPPSFADEVVPVTVLPSRVQNVCDISSASGCNVCAQCCKSYITAGHSCDHCVKEECPVIPGLVATAAAAAAAAAPGVATRQADNRITARLAKLKRFGQRKAVMLSVHVTHHAGTILCDRFRHLIPQGSTATVNSLRF